MKDNTKKTASYKTDNYGAHTEFIYNHKRFLLWAELSYFICFGTYYTSNYGCVKMDSL